MMKYLCQTRRTCLLLLCVVAPYESVAAPDKARRLPALTIQSEVYQNACAPSELRKLRKSLSSEKVAEEAQVWKAIEVLLCAPRTKSTQRYIASILANKIRDSAEGTAQDSDFAVIKPSPELAGSLLANRSAWDASISLDVDHVTLSYHSDEACMNSRTLRFIKPTWRISEIGNACD